MRRTAKWLLYGQLTLTAAALVLTGLALTSSTTTRSTTTGMTVVGGAMVSTPVIVVGVLLIAAAVLGLLALRRPNLHSWAVIALLAPLVSALATSATGSTEEDAAGTHLLTTYGIAQSFEETLRLLELSSWLILGAAILAAATGVLLLQLRRKQGLS